MTDLIRYQGLATPHAYLGKFVAGKRFREGLPKHIIGFETTLGDQPHRLTMRCYDSHHYNKMCHLISDAGGFVASEELHAPWGRMKHQRARSQGYVNLLPDEPLAQHLANLPTAAVVHNYRHAPFTIEHYKEWWTDLFPELLMGYELVLKDEDQLHRLKIFCTKVNLEWKEDYR